MMIGAVRRVPTHGTAGSRRHRHQCAAGFVAQFVQSVESSQPHDEAESDDRAPGRLDQIHGRLRRSAGRDEIVDDQHPIARTDGRRLDLHFFGAVFEIVFLGDGLRRQLARLAYRDESLPSMAARAGPNRNPLASSPATASNESSGTEGWPGAPS